MNTPTIPRESNVWSPGVALIVALTGMMIDSAFGQPLRLSMPQRNPESWLISFPTYTNWTYELDYSSDLCFWRILDAGLQAGGGTAVLADSDSAPQRFYRLSARPLPERPAPSFCRVRAVISSSSDWTTLSFKGTQSIVSAKWSPVSAQISGGWSPGSLWVHQPFANAQAGQRVEGMFDFVLRVMPEPVLALESTKGDFGRVTIQTYQFNSNAQILVGSVTNATTGRHPNTMGFSLSSSALLDGRPDFGTLRPRVPRSILAFYYPWYAFSAWGSTNLRDRPLTLYSSGSDAAIARHLRQARQSGIDGFISSWWGPNSFTDVNLGKLLAEAARQRFKVSIYFETLTDDPPHARPVDEILAWLRYFFLTYGNHPNLLRIEGKPVLFIWAAGSLPASTWAQIFSTLRSEGHDAYYIGNTLSASYLTAFDGLHDYGPAFNTNLESDFANAAGACKTYGWLDNQWQFRVWAASAQPGYDDRSLPGRTGAYIDRANGSTYSRTFDASLNSDPDYILITSFSEWWENTHIEPSTNYGSFYLDLTAQYADLYKGPVPRPPFDFRITPVSETNGTVSLSWRAPLGQTPTAYRIYRSTMPIRRTDGLVPLATQAQAGTFSDLVAQEGQYYYAVAPIFRDTEGPLSESLKVYVSRTKTLARPNAVIPVDVALYLESTGWLSQSEAQAQATTLINRVTNTVSRVQILSASALRDWILAHIKNGHPDVLVTFGDFPASIYPSGNAEPDDSLAELFLEDGNIILNTGDYIFYGNGRNGEEGLMNMMDLPTTMWGSKTSMTVTAAGTNWTPSLRAFGSERSFHLNELQGTQWHLEVAFATDGQTLADPAIVRDSLTGGRIGIVYQTGASGLPRGQVMSEIILNWLPAQALK